MSSATIGPPRVLDGPIPVPARYNLLTVATIYDDLDYHYLAGGQIYPYPKLDDGDTHNPCATGTNREKIDGGVTYLPEWGAYTAYVAETCTARGIGDDEAFRDRAVIGLTGLEAALVEREFATGVAMPANPYLADISQPNYASLGTLKTVEALARLENAIAATGKMGVIHADPATATAWASACTVEREGAYLRAIATGTPIVVGYGYVGAKPDGQAAPPATAGWAWATGPIQIRRTGVEIVPGSLSAALDRQNNVVTYRAERHYLVDWDTELQAAVLVDRT
jgi:hypothetical protein